MIVYDVPDRKFSDDVMLLFMVGLNLEKICYSSACRGCREINPRKRNKSYTGFLHDNGFVTSRYLSTHITKRHVPVLGGPIFVGNGQFVCLSTGFF